MRLELGQEVHTTDGIFGELGDIVVDPQLRTVTHLVVEPDHQHLQARLVPIRLVSEEEGRLLVNLDQRQLRELQPVAFTDFIRVGEPIVFGDAWDVGTQDLISHPYLDLETGFGPVDDSVDMAFDRIPKGECEIRRKSEVFTSDGQRIGIVEGFLAEDDHLTAVVVESGFPGIRHHALVPISSVASVRTDRIDLSIDRTLFRELPTSEGSTADATGPFVKLHSLAGDVVETLSARRRRRPAAHARHSARNGGSDG